MISGENIKIILFTILCICLIFYLSIGVYSYKKDKRSKINVIFLIICISISFWCIGYAFMLISPNIEIANIWRLVALFGSCFFNGLILTFVLSLKNIENKKSDIKIHLLVYIPSIIFFVYNLPYEPSKIISNESYGFVSNLYFTTTSGNIFSIYLAVLLITDFVIVYLIMKNSRKNRVKKQMKIIMITSIISFCLGSITDFICPLLGIRIFPFGLIAMLIGMVGMWYAINKYKMMSISNRIVSDYIFQAVNEPIFILGEDFLVKNCNQATLKITGYNYEDLNQISLQSIINFRNINFNTLKQVEEAKNIEVDLHRVGEEDLVCELSATIMHDEYKDTLAILTQLHDISERKKIAKIQKEANLRLEEMNLKLKNNIIDRLQAQEQIRHFVYYDALTGVSNRKKMLEEIDLLLKDKNEKFAILFIDLDKFKSVNDNYGHQAGDDILKATALRLKSIIESTDTISRIGGDEFIIILRNLKSTQNAKKIAKTALDQLNRAFIYKNNKLFIGGSIGISIFPEHGIDADTLINNADLSMYEVKREGGDRYRVYSNSN
ncbi:diguanylate cyclase [Clostridium sp.]|uniref:diguanylate cyclase domain-containing protein n=1 Tax=Clostridium sp. TaxID=1506 RepID=UPI001A37B56A|nr:diguanylate cyclase [Clostridium sp.]MBK5241399.1 diguanylate cyclase [Clostridium sp.]